MTVTLLHLSDTHVTPEDDLEDGVNALASLKAVIMRLEGDGVAVDGVVATGDLAHYGDIQSCKRVRSVLQELAAPILAVPGNHDRPEAVHAIFPFRSLELEAWRIFGVDTSRAGQSRGVIDTASLVRDLDGFDPRPTVLAMHHPPLSPSVNPIFGLEGAPELLAALGERPHVRAVLSGHLHAPFVERISNGAVIFGAPSTLVGFRHLAQGSHIREFDSSGAQLITLHDDGSVSVRRVGGVDPLDSR